MIDHLSVIKEFDFEEVINLNEEDLIIPSPVKRHYVQQAKRFGQEGVDAVYFSGEYPAIYFKAVSDFTPDTVQSVIRIQRKIWNQGKVPFLYVESPTEIRVYNCSKIPQKEDNPNAEQELKVAFANKVKADLNELRAVFDKVAVESGSIYKEQKYADLFKTSKRIDRALIENLKNTRSRLQGDLPIPVIHDLLLRSLFILYLEDRGATDKAFYEKYLSGADSYFKILADTTATYRLFSTLETTFNGNLCPVQDIEQRIVTKAHLEEVKRCFWSDRATTGQERLFDWRIFDFKFIPIQVISEIYEDFLSKEVGQEQMAQTGAFYTPHPLAEFILNQVLPYPSVEDSNHNIRTLDPTCGSGVFLVDALNRLLDRWEFAHPGQKLTFETIKRIVLDNIFGVEIEAEAIKVTAFSIYLTMLDRLDPKTLWQDKRFPYLVHDPKKPGEKQGRNLFQMSSLGNGSFAEQTYDLVVGNPPFTNKVSAEVRTYLEELKSAKELEFAQETVIAFLHRVTEFCPTGKIALISTSKILFNHGLGYQRFRKFLFQDTYVEKVYNFSALRRVSQQLGGRNLFASATRPVCVLIYSKQKPALPSERLIYYTPTTAIRNRLIDGIAIDPTDVKYLPRTECQKPDSKIWKATMWGTERDFELIQRLTEGKTIGEYLENNDFSVGVGFQISSSVYNNTSINRLPHMPADRLSRYYTTVRNSLKISRTEFRRLGATKTYEAPHLLIKEGQSNKRFCASYLDYNCSFRDTVFGIHSNTKKDDLKILVAYLNSSFASYIMFLTTADWGVERERVKPTELLGLPNICFSLSETFKNQIIGKIDEIIDFKKNGNVLFTDTQIAEIESEIEKILQAGIGLSDNDRVLIEDLLAYRLGAFQDRQKSPAFRPVSTNHMHAYTIYLCQTINHFLQADDSFYAYVQYFDVPAKTPLQVVILYLDEQKRDNEAQPLSADSLSAILRELETYVYRQESESIYFRRFFRYYKDDVVYIVKPNEQRFWSRSTAMNDADEIILEILSSEVE